MKICSPLLRSPGHELKLSLESFENKVHSIKNLRKFKKEWKLNKYLVACIIWNNIDGAKFDSIAISSLELIAKLIK